MMLVREPDGDNEQRMSHDGSSCFMCLHAPPWIPSRALKVLNGDGYVGLIKKLNQLLGCSIHNQPTSTMEYICVHLYAAVDHESGGIRVKSVFDVVDGWQEEEMECSVCYEPVCWNTAMHCDGGIINGSSGIIKCKSGKMCMACFDAFKMVDRRPNSVASLGFDHVLCPVCNSGTLERVLVDPNYEIYERIEEDIYEREYQAGVEIWWEEEREQERKDAKREQEFERELSEIYQGIWLGTWVPEHLEYIYRELAPASHTVRSPTYCALTAS